MDSISGKAGTNVTLPAGTGDIYKLNYRFISWNTKEDGSGTEYEGEDVIENIQADLTLYAQWESLFEVLEGDDWSCTTTAEALDMDYNPPAPSDVIVVTMTTVDDGSFAIVFNDTSIIPTLYLATVEGTYSLNEKSETDGVMSGTLTYNPGTGYDPDDVSGTVHIVDDNEIIIFVTNVGDTSYDPPIQIDLTRPEE